MGDFELIAARSWLLAEAREWVFGWGGGTLARRISYKAFLRCDFSRDSRGLIELGYLEVVELERRELLLAGIDEDREPLTGIVVDDPPTDWPAWMSRFVPVYSYLEFADVDDGELVLGELREGLRSYALAKRPAAHHLENLDFLNALGLVRDSELCINLMDTFISDASARWGELDFRVLDLQTRAIDLLRDEHGEDSAHVQCVVALQNCKERLAACEGQIERAMVVRDLAYALGQSGYGTYSLDEVEPISLAGDMMASALVKRLELVCSPSTSEVTAEHATVTGIAVYSPETAPDADCWGVQLLINALDSYRLLLEDKPDRAEAFQVARLTLDAHLTQIAGDPVARTRGWLDIFGDLAPGVEFNGEFSIESLMATACACASSLWAYSDEDPPEGVREEIKALASRVEAHLRTREVVIDRARRIRLPLPSAWPMRAVICAELGVTDWIRLQEQFAYLAGFLEQGERRARSFEDLSIAAFRISYSNAALWLGRNAEFTGEIAASLAMELTARDEFDEAREWARTAAEVLGPDHYLRPEIDAVLALEEDG
jgi:hypothetical protein